MLALVGTPTVSNGSFTLVGSTGSVNTAVIGVYTLTYSKTNAAGKVGSTSLTYRKTDVAGNTGTAPARSR